jgi:G protein-coupled receptor 107
VDFHYKNKDKIGLDSYLTAGEMPLPIIFFYFFIGYLVCTVIWILNIKGIQKGHEGCFALPGERPIVYAIHHLMSILLILKTMALLLEAIRYHYIRITGYAKFWSGMFYAISFVKSIFLFTVVLLIGSGWSFVKPFLSGKEKVIIFLVLLMQIINNIAIVVLASESEGENAYDDWSAILHILDILCCCAVLIPIVWQVRNLENSLSDDEDSDSMENGEKEEIAEKQKTLNKLKLFRSFYLIVVAYVYFTRVAVYLFATLLDYRHAWIRYLFIETATLSFYTIMGFQFRPMPENSYVVGKKRDDDEFVFEREIELRYSRKH